MGSEHLAWMPRWGGGSGSKANEGNTSGLEQRCCEQGTCLTEERQKRLKEF